MNPEDKALAVREETAVDRRSVYDVLERLVHDPTVTPERILGFMEVQMKAEAIEAERQFRAAMVEVMPELPRIVKHGKQSMKNKEGVDKGTIPFAKWDDIDEACRPILARHGLSISFKSNEDARGVSVTLHVTHRAGFVDKSTMTLPPDAGPGRNPVQALGSALSYAKRYLFTGYFNIVTIGEDDDAQSIGYVSEQQANVIEDMIHEAGLTEERRSKFLTLMQAKTVSEIKRNRYREAVTALTAAIRKAERDEKDKP